MRAGSASVLRPGRLTLCSLRLCPCFPFATHPPLLPTPPHLPLSDFSSTPSFPPSLLYLFPSLLHSGVAMGRGILCCLPEPIDYDADVNLFHFELHRAIGKGAFGKVRPSLISLSFNLGFKLGITSSGPSCGTQEIKETLCS